MEPGMEIWLGVKQAQESRVLKTREPLQWDVGKDACSEPQRRDMATKALLELVNGAGFPMSTCRWTQHLNSDRVSTALPRQTLGFLENPLAAIPIPSPSPGAAEGSSLPIKTFSPQARELLLSGSGTSLLEAEFAGAE